MLTALTRDEKTALIKEIQGYFAEEKGEEIGIIAAENLLDFFLDNLGKKIYNKALDDARIWFGKRLEMVEVDFDLLYQRNEGIVRK
jgi:uncharacterized protein (DUF2164 family)